MSEPDRLWETPFGVFLLAGLDTPLGSWVRFECDGVPVPLTAFRDQSPGGRVGRKSRSDGFGCSLVCALRPKRHEQQVFDLFKPRAMRASRRALHARVAD